MRNRLLTRTFYSGLIVTAVIALFFLFLDRPISGLAHELKNTWVHNGAVGLSYLADHTVVFLF